MTKLAIFIACFGFSSAIRFVPTGYQILDPQTGHVLPSSEGSRVNFAPPITDELFNSAQRNPRQVYQNRNQGELESLFPDTFRFFSNGNGNSDDFYRPLFRKERKVIPYRYQSSGRYQPSTKTTYAHKKRQKNPYYGRKKRSAEPEPYTLIDPLTGRNVEKTAQKTRKRLSPFLFGLPFDLFNDGDLKQNKRPQRKSPEILTPISGRTLSNPYVATSGIPLYKYRNKHPHGYGRKKRDAQSWILLDPVTGRTLNQEAEQKQTELNQSELFEDPLEQQFVNPEIRASRQPVYVSESGTPLYKYRNKYPHGYSG